VHMRCSLGLLAPLRGVSTDMAGLPIFPPNRQIHVADGHTSAPRGANASASRASPSAFLSLSSKTPTARRRLPHSTDRHRPSSSPSCNVSGDSKAPMSGWVPTQVRPWAFLRPCAFLHCPRSGQGGRHIGGPRDRARN
jgi:hypothetical protein